MRLRFWAASVLGGVGTALAVLTVITREWIEVVFGVDPDGGNGSLEWAIVAVAAVTAVVCLGYVRIEWRRVGVSQATGHA